MKQLVVYVFGLLLVLMGCTTADDRARMRVGLDSINVRNRTDQPFTIQDVEPYVQFFDNHGTPNDRLLAHYLLGRAYNEAGEAPMALQCYQDAADCADTTAKDCDYSQLSRVYGQMAEVFYHQGLYQEQLQTTKVSARCAWKGGDTLAALMNYEQESFAYKSLGMQDSALLVIEDVVSKYKQYGYSTNAAISVGAVIRILADMGEYQKAKKYMDIYESESGLFDAEGNIAPKREIYYRVKGLYYLFNNKLDSAEYYFRKELRDGKDFNNQNAAAKGLAELYQKLHCADSSAKYYQYAYAMNDSAFAHTATKTIERMQAMYDYSRHQKIAHQEKEKANRRFVIICICVGFIVIIILSTYIVIRELSRKKKDAEQKYLQSQAIIEQAQQDISKLRLDEEVNRELISEKEQTIREQETILKSLLRQDSNSQSVAEKGIKTTTIYKKFEQLSVVGQQPSIEEWIELEQQINHYYPGFKEFLVKHEYLLNDKQRKTCLLIRIDIKPKMISHMLAVDPSYISNIRTEMLQKLFCMSGNSKAFDKLIKNIY